MEVEYFKVLVQGDMVERLTVPISWMDLLGPLFIDGNREATVRAVDSGGMFWELCCKTRVKAGYEVVVFQAREWNRFIRYAGLQVGDRVVLQEDNEAQFRGIISYRIIAQRMDDEYGLWANLEPPERADPNLVHLF